MGLLFQHWAGGLGFRIQCFGISEGDERVWGLGFRV